MARQHWPAAGPARGRVLLLHGLSSIADSWWRMGPRSGGILEEPPSLLRPDTCLALADGIVADVAAVRADRRPFVERVRGEHPGWADEDIHWAVQGIAEMDPEPFAGRLRALAHDERLRRPTPDRVLAAAPAAHVLAARSGQAFFDGGSALDDADRDALARRLPAGHVVGIVGGHCLHRDAPGEWLAAVRAILG